MDEDAPGSICLPEAALRIMTDGFFTEEQNCCWPSIRELDHSISEEYS